MKRRILLSPFTWTWKVVWIALLVMIVPQVVLAAVGAAELPILLLWIAAILLFAKVGMVLEKLGIPSVLSEILAGIVIGNMSLIGINLFLGLESHPIIIFLAQLGVIILLFQTGLESNIHEMRKVGVPSTLVALLGIIGTFIVGAYFISPAIFSDVPPIGHLFFGAALATSSAGLSARVLKDMKLHKTSEAKIVLGAAVIDDILGLVILAVLVGVVSTNNTDVLGASVITAKAVLFIIGALLLGRIVAPWFGKVFSAISSGSGMKLSLAIIFALVFAAVASVLGLAPIIGAFAAGLVLDSVVFKKFKDPAMNAEIKETLCQCHADKKTEKSITKVLDEHASHHIDDLIEPIAHFLVPIFFVHVGTQISLGAILQPGVIITALVVAMLGIVLKVASGLGARGYGNWALVGLGMVPRGEVAIIVGTLGLQLGVLNQTAFSVIVLLVLITTFVTPSLITLVTRHFIGSSTLAHKPVKLV